MPPPPRKSAASETSRESPPMAAVDIGSNATRMLIGRTNGGGFSRLLFTRVPLALGRDSYGAKNIISAPAQKRLAAALLGLQKIAEAMEVKRIKFVATAAVRDCKNKTRLLANIRRRAGADIEILDGDDEAEIIGAFIARQFPAARAVLNADTGGGSTDCAVIKDGIVAARATFNIGTARPRDGAAKEKNRMRTWLKQNCGEDVTAASSGGGARKLESLCGEISGRALSQFLSRAEKMNDDRRARAYNLTPDRARNIVPAARIAKLILESLHPGARKLHTINGGLGEAVLVNMLAECDAKKRKPRANK